MLSDDLRGVGSHFRFGENWSDYAGKIDDRAMAEAKSGLSRLLGDDLRGKRFLDIGSGSGLHSLAALQLGAAEVLALDIDPDSVATTAAVLRRFAPGFSWSVQQLSVFDADSAKLGRFDIVYSWGVLHHTGALHEAMKHAATLVAPGGKLCIALYGRTALCGFWRQEKRLYSRGPATVQRLLRGLYIAWFWSISTAGGIRHGRRFSIRRFIVNYATSRGMSFYNDVHDWLGGYPYESISPAEVTALMTSLGLREERRGLAPGNRMGLLGSGCDEYVFST